MKGVEQKRREFTEFCIEARDECLRVVEVMVGVIRPGVPLVCHTSPTRPFPPDLSHGK